MKILLLAPHPFLQERGTPLAVDLLLRTLSEFGHDVDVLTFHEGQDVSYPGVTIERIRGAGWIRNVRPGFSWKKIVCDMFFFAAVWRRTWRRRHDLIWAVEESAFMARLVTALRGVPYVYDMDSSIAQQLEERTRAFRLMRPLLQRIEASAIKNARGIVAVCDALEELARSCGAAKTTILRDVPLTPPAESGEGADTDNEDIRATLKTTGELFLYVGNLEAYQGIDLLLESFALARADELDAHLVVIGGTPHDIEHYTTRCTQLQLIECVHFLGPRPVAALMHYLCQADVLVSPRTKGNNTPMKLYSYLSSGVPVLATDLPTHTQVLDSRVALLAAPEPMPFSEAMRRLSRDENLRRGLGEAARALVAERYSLENYRSALGEFLAGLNDEAAAPTRELTRG